MYQRNATFKLSLKMTFKMRPIVCFLTLLELQFNSKKRLRSIRKFQKLGEKVSKTFKMLKNTYFIFLKTLKSIVQIHEL